MHSKKEIRDYIASIKKGSVDFDHIADFKYLFQIDEKEFIVQKLGKLALRKIFSHPFPSSFSQFCAGFNTIASDSTPLHEIRWYLETFEIYSQKVKLFLELKEQLEIAILIGDQTQIDNAINFVDDQIGLSYYLLLSEMFINEKNGDDNKELLADYISQGLTDKSQVLLEFGRYRLDKKISSWQYDNIIGVHKTLYEGLEKDVEKNFLDYINFKMEVNNYEKQLEKLAFVLYFESDLALIDRYDAFKKISPYLLKSIGHGTQYIELISGIRYLLRITGDTFWHNLLLSVGEEKNYPIDERARFYSSVSEAFFAGNWNDVSTRVSEKLLTNPNHSELYLFFVKSVISLKKEIKEFLKDRSELYDILQLIKNVLEKKESYIVDREKLLKKYYSISHFEFANVILEILFYELKVTIPYDVQQLAFCTSGVLTYNFFNSVRNRKQCEHIINSLKSSSKYYRTIYDYINTGELPQHNTISEIQGVINFLISQGNYQAALGVIDSLKANKTEISDNYSVTWYTKASLKCLIECQLFDRSAELIVDYFFENGFIYDHFIDQKHVKELIEVDNEVVLKNISVPIALHLFNVSHLELYDGLANFLVQYGYNVPSELLEIQHSFPNDRLVYLLEKISTLEVIESSPFLNTIEQLELERITILNYLKQLNPEKHDNYNEEILNITKASSIRKGLKQIHESRIYVDINSIEKKYEAEFQEYFNKYLEFDNTKDIDIAILSLDKTTAHESKVMYYLDEPFKDKPSKTGNQKLVEIEVPYIRYVYYVDLFEHLVNAFVFDEDYGFKSYLSMRIRHGTFSNILRNVFDKNNLISSKKRETDEYVDTQYWNDNLKDQHKTENVQNLIKKFSREVDDTIDKGLGLINIKQDPKEVGVFDFLYTEAKVRSLYYDRLGRISDFKTFVKEVFEILFDVLKGQLKHIRAFIDRDMKARFLYLLDDLGKQIEELDLAQQDKNLIADRIVSCKTEIQVTTFQIIKWFNVSKNQYIEAFTIDIVLDASLNYIDIISGKSLSKAEVNTTNNCREKFKGKYFEAFNDIFNNIFDNILKYNKDLGNELKISIDILCEERKLQIAVKNNLSESVDYNVLQKKIEIISEIIENYTSDTPVSYEHGSGYPKICKSVVVGLSRTNYSIEPSATESEFQVNINFDINDLV